MQKDIKTDTKTLIKSLKILSDDIISEDGIANSAILEAAYRLEELYHKDCKITVEIQPDLLEAFKDKCSKETRTVSEVVRELVSKYSQGWIQTPIEFNHKDL